MSVPKKKTSKSKRDMRQAGKGLRRKMNLRRSDDGSVTMSHVVVTKRIRPTKSASDSK